MSAIFTNADRAEKARAAVEHYCGDPDLETSIGDVLGDLRHLCDEQGFDFDALLERGRDHYDYELADEAEDKALLAADES